MATSHGLGEDSGTDLLREALKVLYDLCGRVRQIEWVEGMGYDIEQIVGIVDEAHEFEAIGSIDISEDGEGPLTTVTRWRCNECNTNLGILHDGSLLCLGCELLPKQSLTTIEGDYITDAWD